MEITSKQIIGELVAEDYRAATVFKERNIDFCCNGDRTIGEACALKKIDENEVLNALEKVIHGKNTPTDHPKDMTPDVLADYIVETHHTYVEKKLPELKAYLKKVAAVHGEHNPEVIKIHELFEASAGELAMHMKKEEMILFPFIRQMMKAKASGEPLIPPHFGTAENPINMMKHEHATEGDRFREIAELSNNYTPPTHACNTYRVSYAMLQEFENDLHRHIHLENNILFPKALKLEKELMELSN
ncbi:iron-sulfur cluster repair di-iron protein [Ekhidna sp.]|uniref:iron-sulfur cluster repair di-iron protein n=1 Tax=Ekhidna sp. TaxID=2608089 RepID=UPI003299BC45